MTCGLHAHVQIKNNTDIRLSSVTGDGVASFTRLIASIALGMPHVNQTVPKAYVDLGSSLETWSRDLIAMDVPPVCTRTMVHERVAASAALSRHLPDQAVINRALDFLAAGGVVVLAHNSAQSVILDPGWLADTLACVITMNPVQLERLPPALVHRGMLRHTLEALIAVWPEDKGYSGSLRLTLLSLLHRFDLAYEVWDGGGVSLGFSVVPSMLPNGVAGLVSPDGAMGPLSEGHSEVGVEYRLDYVPPDLWPLLILRFAGMVIPETCTRTSTVLHWAGQRGLVTLNVDDRVVRLVVRGPAPVELRVRFHWTLVGMLSDKYPHLVTVDSLCVVCHGCHRASPMVGRPLKLARAGDPFHCMHCYRPSVVLPVDDLIESPASHLDRALALAAPHGVAHVGQLCSLAARVADTSKALMDGRGNRVQLWLPIPAPFNGGGGAGAGAGAGTGAASGSSSDDDPVGIFGWVRVCEDPSGWHVQGHAPVVPTTPLDGTVLRAVAPVLRRVAEVLCATSPVTGSHLPIEWRDWLATQEALGGDDVGRGDVSWAAFALALVKQTRASGAGVAAGADGALKLRSGRWLCPLHVQQGRAAAGGAAQVSNCSLS